MFVLTVLIIQTLMLWVTDHGCPVDRLIEMWWFNNNSSLRTDPAFGERSVDGRGCTSSIGGWALARPEGQMGE
jgi:hypothetical protein